MEQIELNTYEAKLIKCVGVSAKTGKPYEIQKLKIQTEKFGEIYIQLDYKSNLVLKLDNYERN